jgi:hypothetical protein
MKIYKTTYPLLCLLVVLTLWGCASTNRKEVIGTVSGKPITAQDLERAAGKPKPYGSIDGSIDGDSPADPEELVSQRRALLRMALKLKINEDPCFIKALERYWESAMIAELLEKKREELRTIKADDKEARDYADCMGTDIKYMENGKIKDICCQDIGPKFAKELYSMKPGEVKHIKKAGKSVVVRMLEKKREPRPIELHWYELKALVTQRKRAEALKEWINSAVEEATVK